MFRESSAWAGETRQWFKDGTSASPALSPHGGRQTRDTEEDNPPTSPSISQDNWLVLSVKEAIIMTRCVREWNFQQSKPTVVPAHRSASIPNRFDYAYNILPYCMRSFTTDIQCYNPGTAAAAAAPPCCCGKTIRSDQEHVMDCLHAPLVTLY